MIKLKNKPADAWLLITQLVLLLICWPVWSGLSVAWLAMDGNYSHGFLLLLVAVVLVYERRHAINVAVAEYSPVGIGLFIISALLFHFSNLLLIGALSEFFLVSLILTIIWAVFGFSILKICAMPIALLFFAVSVWDQVVYSLQLLTVSAIQWPLLLFGVEFSITDTYVTIPDIGVFKVAYGCSGLRYLLVSMSLSMIIALLWFDKVSERIIVVVLAALFGLLSNWLRVAIIIYIGYRTNMQSGLVEDHDAFGWILFASLLFPFMYFVVRWSNLKRSVVRQECAASLETQQMPLSSLLVSVILLLALFVLQRFDGQSQNYGTKYQPKSMAKEWLSLPQGVSIGIGSYYLNPTGMDKKSYYRNNNENIIRLDHNIYHYLAQKNGSELYGYVNKPFDSSVWAVESHITSENYELFQLHKKSLGSSHDRQKVYLLRGFYVGHKFYGKADVSRFMQVPAVLQGTSYVALQEVVISCESCSLISVINPDDIFSANN